VDALTVSVFCYTQYVKIDYHKRTYYKGTVNVDGHYHGTGLLSQDVNQGYQGDWYDGKKDGEGMFKLHTDIYLGDWRNDLKEGKGEMWYYYGATKKNRHIPVPYHYGDWLAGKQHGKGFMRFHDGGEYIGDWADDKMHGLGVYTYPNGTVYDGRWYNDQKVAAN
jgi:hypothetical protein